MPDREHWLRHTKGDHTLLSRSASLLRGMLAATALVALVGGTPWALTRFVGWPLPHHLPSWPEIEGALISPMSVSLLLRTMACILWPIWAAFVLDVARALANEARALPRPAIPRPGPFGAVAAVLVGTIFVALLSQRAAVPSSSAGTVATATGASTPSAANRVTAPDRLSATSVPDTVEVAPPRDGVYDSLWRIADRTLGDGSRWPEIYVANRGRPQPDGSALTNPNLIRPGWILRLPSRPPAGAHPPKPREPATPNPSPGASPPGGNTAPPSSPTRHTHEPRPEPGISLPNGAFVGIALAALIAAAALIVRRRRRTRYLPGSGDRDNLAIAPVVRALRLAYDEASRPPDEPDFLDGPDWAAEPRPARTEAGGPMRETASISPDLRWDGGVIGVKDGQALAWDLAQARGLGLVGPGAHDAARALLVALLARQHEPSARSVRVVVPAADWRLLIGERTGGSPQLHIADDLDGALDWVESELLTRVRNRRKTPTRSESPASPQADLVLVATPAPHADSRLQAIFDNGSAFGLAGILLAQWRPGVTVGIAPNGTVTTASSSAPDAFGDARLFTLPADDAQALIDLLAEAQPAAPLPATHPSESTSAAHDEERGAQSRAPGKSLPSTTGDDSRQPSRLQRTTGQVPVSTKPLQLVVLGSPCLIHRQGARGRNIDLTSALAPKQRELLVYLALHREGARREAIVAAIWPGAPQDRPYNSFHATLSQLRRALRTATQGAISDVTTHADGRYTLDDAQVAVDLWHLRDALDASRPGVGVQSQHSALERVVELYSGDLADDVGAEWIEAPREAIRRDVMDAVSALVRLLREREPGQALSLLERVRTFDPFNEAIYRDIARFQAHLGHHDAVARTFKLLETTLAEIDEEPSPETVALQGSLQRVHPPHHRESDSTA